MTGAKKSQLSSELYYRDTSHHFDDRENSGHKIRSFTYLSKTLDMMGKLHCDLMNMSRYLINAFDVKIRLIKSNEAFHLLSDGTVNYKTNNIDNISLFVRKVKLNPVVALSHSKALLTSNAKYPFKRTLIKSFSIPQGQLSATKNNLFSNQLPTRVIVFFVNSEAFNGVYTQSPFNFKHNDLSIIYHFL